MKLTDGLAMSVGTVIGSVQPDELTSVIAAAVSAIAVYFLKYFLGKVFPPSAGE